MLQRILEPEVMDTVSEAEDYNAMDHSTVNRVFVDDFLAALKTIVPVTRQPWKIFDAGTGTALIPLELISRGIPMTITAADLAEEMLVVARRNIANAENRTPHAATIRLIRADCKVLEFPDGAFDAVVSNSIIHHIPDPTQVFRECWRVLRPGGLMFFRDLMRPHDLDELHHLVETYAGTANDHGRQMFRDSLHAALTVKEVEDMMQVVGIKGRVRATSDQHWTLTAVNV